MLFQEITKKTLFRRALAVHVRTGVCVYMDSTLLDINLLLHDI